MSSSVTWAPRRTVTAGAASTAFAKTHSPTGRRAVSVQSLSSIGRGDLSVKTRRQRVQQVELRGPGGGQRLLHIRKIGLQDLAEAGHEVVRLPELRDALAIPMLPGGLR